MPGCFSRSDMMTMGNDDTPRRRGQPELSDLGILTLGQLLRTCSTSEGCAKVAKATGMSQDRLRRMLVIATPQNDLPETEKVAQRLEAAGLSVVKDLSRGRR